MLGFILTNSAELVLWTATKTVTGLYYGTKYLIYGNQKTESEVLKEELDEVKVELRRLRESISGADKENEDGFIVVK